MSDQGAKGPAPAAEPQLPPPQGREKEELSDGALCLATQPPAEVIEAMARAICRSWYYCDLDKPDGIQHWENEQGKCRKQALAAWAAYQKATVGDPRGNSESHRTQGRESVIEELDVVASPHQSKSD